ncbi:MAG: hypothetical protein QM774_07530 [Gordonia sp. (in: high G+C Gram-positive bacteria)]
MVVPLVLWGIVDPKGSWRALESWKYKNPDANEPSEASYALSRVGGVIGLVLLIGMGVMAYNDSRDDEAPRDKPSASYTQAEMKSKDLDLGAGTLVGYRYPSALTLDVVYLDDDGLAYPEPSCDVDVTVYEHTNAIVVQVTQSAHALYWTGDPEPDLARACDGQRKTPHTVNWTLQEPLGDRPILTAAPLADPRAAGTALATGPARPLDEVPEPGVKEQLKPVRIDPAWKLVPLLAATQDEEK